MTLPAPLFAKLLGLLAHQVFEWMAGMHASTGAPALTVLVVVQWRPCLQGLWQQGGRVALAQQLERCCGWAYLARKPGASGRFQQDLLLLGVSTMLLYSVVWLLQ